MIIISKYDKVFLYKVVWLLGNFSCWYRKPVEILEIHLCY